MITVTAAANSGAARQALVTIGGQTLQVTQAAVAPCTYTLSANSLSAPSGGLTTTTTITASGGTCSWTATSGVGWITVSPTNGTGSRGVTITVAANTGTARTAYLTMAGLSYLVTQSAVGCSYTLSTLSLTVPVAGGTLPVTITPNLGTCSWAVVNPVSWLTVTPGSGTGQATLSLVVTANSGSPRTTTLIIGGQSLAVTQAATSGGTPPQAAQTVIIR
jgi:hypothetical protein